MPPVLALSSLPPHPDSVSAASGTNSVKAAMLKWARRWAEGVVNGRYLDTWVMANEQYASPPVYPKNRRNAVLKQTYDLGSSFGWYDLTVASEALPKFQRRFAGHVETDRDSKTDPAIGSASLSNV